MPSTQGKLLIASPRLADPNFARTVVLMVQHNDQGALGLVLNRPLQITVREACQQSLTDPCGVEAFLHQGGPCQGPLMVLHGCELSKDSDVLPGVYFTTERGKIESLLRQPTDQARYFVGYSGWGAGQLEAEMEIESWLIVPADSNLVFEGKSNLWSKLMAGRMLGRAADISSIPDDPSMN
ncbi:MAG: YqgE/AlgH family protein [Tepidisphaeraceae bacterium]|jgi:putative transcriptional regulator